MRGPIFIGSPPIEIRLKRNTRAKRLTLRLSRTDGQATLTLPTRASIRQAQNFAARQEVWLRVQIARLPECSGLVAGGTLPFRGVDLEIVATSGRSIRADGSKILVGGKHSGARLQAFIKTEARSALVPAVEKYAAKINRPFKRITLRDTRSRWGSCSAEGNLMFSWRLVMAPPIVLEYVAAHEVAHLVEMNHSPAFWDVVETLMPEFQKHRNWLRENGAKLHAVKFIS
ncbi:MAG: SprT family zinc-dependent metalloprotease [Paracoccaceae bacterium]